MIENKKQIKNFIALALSALMIMLAFVTPTFGASSLSSDLSTAKNIEIEPALLISGKLRLTVSYDYYNSLNDTNPGIKKEGNTQFKWFKKANDIYTEITGIPSNVLLQSMTELNIVDSYKCELTVYDNDGTQGETVAVEIDTSSAKTAPIISRMVTLYDKDGTELAYLSSALGKVVDMRTSCNITSPTSGSHIEVYYATYDKDDVLLDVSMVNAGIMIDEGYFVDGNDDWIGTKGSSINDFIIDKNTYSLKAFVWCSGTNAPISPVIVAD